MLNRQLITDLRKTLNEAQDYGQEALANVKRGEKNLPDAPHFEAEAKFYAMIAVRRANAFLGFQKQVAEAL